MPQQLRGNIVITGGIDSKLNRRDLFFEWDPIVSSRLSVHSLFFFSYRLGNPIIPQGVVVHFWDIYIYFFFAALWELLCAQHLGSWKRQSMRFEECKLSLVIRCELIAFEFACVDCFWYGKNNRENMMESTLFFNSRIFNDFFNSAVWAEFFVLIVLMRAKTRVFENQIFVWSLKKNLCLLSEDSGESFMKFVFKASLFEIQILRSKNLNSNARSLIQNNVQNLIVLAEDLIKFYCYI